MFVQHVLDQSLVPISSATPVPPFSPLVLVTPESCSSERRDDLYAELEEVSTAP